MADLVVQGGTVVTPSGVMPATVTVTGGRIEAVVTESGAPQLAPQGSGCRVVDARGCYVIPGGVDPHTHLMADIVAATRAALHGGTTTALSFTSPEPGESLTDAFRRTRDELVPDAACDIGIHASVWEPERVDAGEIEQLAVMGATGVKLFLAFGELGMMASDRMLYETLRACGAHRLMTLVHCESGGVIAARIEELLGQGHVETSWFATARPAETEHEAVTRTLTLAGLADAPVYLVHQSASASLTALRGARSSGQRAWGEACTHHLLFTEERYLLPDAERFLVVPPLRSRRDRDALWDAVARGEIQSIGSDHAQGRTHPVPHPPCNFTEQPYGIPGVELRVPLVLSEGLRRGVPLERLVDLLSGGPARIFDIYPRKGAILPGADADIVVWDPSESWTIGAGDLHDGVPDSPYLGLAVQGRVRCVLRAGEVVIDRGQRVGSGPAARFIGARDRLGQPDVEGANASSSRLAST
jgi:dihydropyrimidinase